jgi:Fe-S cluster assembly ATPase SufC
MTKKQLSEILKYSSPNELYVITHYNVLIRLFCPIKVQVLRDIGILKRGQIVFVDEIKITIELKTVYIIDNEAYYYHHFNIMI